MASDRSPYRRVWPQFWTGETGRKIRKAGLATRVAATYLITGPQANMIGLYCLDLPGMAHQMGVKEEVAEKALTALEACGFCRYDREAEIVWVIEMASMQVGESLFPFDKKCKGVDSLLAALPKTSLRDDFLARYAKPFNLNAKVSPFEAPSEGLGSPFEAPSKPESSEQEQDQEEKGLARAKPASPVEKLLQEAREAKGFVLPENLDNDQFRGVLAEWIDYKRERGHRYKTTGFCQLIAGLSKRGLQEACAALTVAMQRSWQGPAAPDAVAKFGGQGLFDGNGSNPAPAPEFARKIGETNPQGRCWDGKGFVLEHQWRQTRPGEPWPGPASEVLSED